MNPMNHNAKIFLFWILLSVGFSLCNLAYASLPIANKAIEWQQCPPKNPYLPHDTCNTQCCSGSNWDLSCLGFVESVKKAATGNSDPQLMAGNPLPGQIYGSVERAFRAMESAGRAHYEVGEMPAGAAVFFQIDGFAPGHIAIYSGKKDQNGNLLIVSTGGPKWGSGIHIESLSEMMKRPYWHFLGWADL